MTTQEDVWRLLAELTTAQKETDKQLRETDLRQKENARQIKELGKQIGGFGSKFGSFTEGLALPSMEKILTERFGEEGLFVARIDDQVFKLDIPDNFQPQTY